MTFGFSTRAVNGPMGTTGSAAPINRGKGDKANKPGNGDRSKLPDIRDKFVPLSLFFARREGDPNAADDDVIGFRSKKKRQEAEKKAAADAKDQKSKDKKGSKETNADGNRQDGGKTGAGTNAGDDKTVGQALDTGGQEESMQGQGLPIRSGASHVSTGATGTGNIATAPVPLGSPLRRLPRKKKKRKKGERLKWIEQMLGS